MSGPVRAIPSAALRRRDRDGERTLRELVPPHPSPPLQGGRESSSYHLEDQIGFILRRSHQRATAIFNAVMQEFTITPTQFAALTKLSDLGSVSQNELGRLTAMDPATILGVVGRLIKRGYVAQRVDTNDARLVILELTKEGSAAAAAMQRIAAEVSERTLAPLSKSETATLLALLRKLQ